MPKLVSIVQLLVLKAGALSTSRLATMALLDGAAAPAAEEIEPATSAAAVAAAASPPAGVPEAVAEREGAEELAGGGAEQISDEEADEDNVDMGAGGEGVEPAAPAAAPAAVLPRHQRRRQVEIVDLDRLKADRADLKRQLKVCAKEVKAQAGW